MKILKNIFKSLILLTGLLATYQSQASHIASAHMYADYVSPNTYVVTLELYRDCTGINLFGESITISSSCYADITVPMTKDTFYVEQGALCPNVPSTCVNINSPFNGYETHLYRDTITLPGPCADYRFEWNSCCRNPNIDNLNGPSSLGCCITLFMNTLDFPTNSSPRYLELPIPYLCVNQPQAYVNYPFDPDYDSLHTAGYQPIDDDCVQVCPYNPGFSNANPIVASPAAGGYIVSSLTGTAYFTPTQPGSYALAYRTKEHDRQTGQLMSYVERDVQVNVVNCNTPPPILDSTFNGTTGLWTNLDTLAGGNVILDSGTFINLGICPGNELYFEITGYAATISNALYTSINNLQLSAPGATYVGVPTQGVSPITGQFSWTPTANDIGGHTIVINFTDSTCSGAQPIVLNTTVTINIQVYPGVEAGPDQDYCGNTSDTVTINATGPSNVTTWTWETLSGATPTDLAPINSPNAKAWPSTTTTYVLKTDALTSCKNSDTVVVEVHPPINADAGPDNTLCANQNYTLATNIGPTQSILWTPNYNINDTSAVAPVVYPGLTTTYQVEIVDQNNCVYHDSVKITVDGVAPSITAWAERDTICPNGDAQLHVFANSQFCGLAQTQCGGNSAVASMNQGNISSTNTYHPFNNKTPKARAQMILTKDDLNNMGIIGPNYITSLGYNVLTKNSNVPLRNYTINMACTQEQQFTSNDFNLGVYDQVFFRDTIVSKIGLNTLDFDIPYYWDGETSLIFNFCYNSQFVASNTSDNVETISGSANQYVYYLLNSVSGSSTPACEEDANGLKDVRPKLTIGYCEDLGFNLTWSPTTFLDSPSNFDPLATNVTNDPMTWTVTATSNANSNCSNSESVTVYHDKSSWVVANASAPDWNGGAWSTDSVVLCEHPSVFNLRMDTIFTAPVYACAQMNTLCPASSDFLLDPDNNIFPNVNYTPLDQNYRGKRSQYLIPASELNGIGLSEGELNSLSWKVTVKNSPIPYRNFSIKLACTNSDSLTTMLDNANFVTVYSTNEYTPSIGWNTFEFQKNYGWDGTEDLIVEVCYWNGISGPDLPVGTYDMLEYSQLGIPVAQYRNSDIASPTEMCSHIPAGPFTSAQEKSRPNFKFGVCQDVEPTYYWTPGNYINDTSLTNTFGIGTTETGYVYAYVTGRNGCELKDSVKIVTPVHEYEVSPLDTFICSTDRALFDAGIKDKAVSYEWLPATGVENPTGEATHIAIPYGGSFPYEVIWTDHYGCQDTGYVTLNVWDTPVVVLSPAVDTIQYGSSVVITSTGAEVYSWSPINSLDNPFNNVVVATPKEYTDYKIISIDTNGCKGTGHSYIFVDYENPIFIPNAFSPDGDGNNDVFEVANMEYEKIQQFQVYDRWGNIVFDAVESGKTGWDGYIDGQFANEGVYVYLIKLVYRDGKVKSYKGDITLIR